MQKMKKFFLLAGLLAGGFLTTSAQSKIDSPPMLREIGFGTNLILMPVFNRESIPLDFIYKWGNSRRLYRLGTSLTYVDNTRYHNDLSFFSKNQKLASELFIGKEWRLPLAERWLLNYGADVNFNYYYDSYEQEINCLNQEKRRYHSTKSKAVRAGIRSFFGSMFALKPHLLIGVEASFQTGLQYFFQEKKYYTEENGQINKGNNFLDEAGDGWSLHFRTQPVSNFFVYYRF